MSYNNQWLHAPKGLLGLVEMLPTFNYIISMEAMVQSLSMHLLFIIVIITAVILM